MYVEHFVQEPNVCVDGVFSKAIRGTTFLKTLLVFKSSTKYQTFKQIFSWLGTCVVKY